MKRYLLFLFLFPSLCFAAFTEFYTQSGGDNLNAGSTTNNSAVYTSAGGNWANATRIFTVTDGTNPSLSIAVNDYGSVYVTAGATVATFIARVTAVQNATNGTVTFSSTFAGSNPSNGTGTMTLKTGGAWKGPNASTAFPFSLASITNLVNTSNDQVRINVKNDANYSLTSNSLSWTGLASTVVQGYSSSVGDGGKAVLTSSATGAGGTSQFTNSNSNNMMIDLIWDSSGGSNQATLFTNNGAGSVFVRNVFRGARNQGVSINSSCTFFECEFYNNNVANVSSSGNFYTSSVGVTCINCYSHDAANGTGYYVAASGGLCLINSIGETNPGSGAEIISTSGSLVSINSDFYNNTGDAIKLTMSTVGSPVLIVNSNFLKNGGKGINNTKTGQTGIIYNNGRGAGTQANGSSDTLNSIINTSTDITYASNVAPWVAPSTGDFSINLAAAQGAGRSHFEENDGTNTGTVGYPDIGAAQAQVGATFPTPTPTPTVTPTPTTPPESSYSFGG